MLIKGKQTCYTKVSNTRLYIYNLEYKQRKCMCSNSRIETVLIVPYIKLLFTLNTFQIDLLYLDLLVNGLEITRLIYLIATVE